MVDVNTSYIKEAGNDIIDLTSEINELINDTFSLIDSAPWLGDSAESFKIIAKIDKSNYLKFSNDVREYGKFLVDYASSIENVVSKVMR